MATSRSVSGGGKEGHEGKSIVTLEELLEGIYARYRGDPAFEHLRQGSKFVPGYGSLRGPKCIFIGEAPGAEEEKMGAPFLGASGRLLQELLGSIDLKRQHVFTTNVVKYRPRLNRDPTDEEVKQSWPYLLDEINLIEPPIIVPLGRFAFNCFFPTLRITDSRGTELSWEGYRLLPMFHPAVGLYNPANRPALFTDFDTLGGMID